jgi:hypothetical protein
MAGPAVQRPTMMIGNAQAMNTTVKLHNPGPCPLLLRSLPARKTNRVRWTWLLPRLSTVRASHINRPILLPLLGGADYRQQRHPQARATGSREVFALPPQAKVQGFDTSTLSCRAVPYWLDLLPSNRGMLLWSRDNFPVVL